MKQDRSRHTPHSLAELKKDLKLPPNTPFLGYVVWLPPTDEFLAYAFMSGGMEHHGWVRTPEMALTYSHFSEASHQADLYGPPAVVGLLFDIGPSYFVAVSE